MVDRQLITTELVDSSSIPVSGERWIADSAIRGFGLRLWRSKQGRVGKAYGLRVIGPDGKVVRRTLNREIAIAMHHGLMSDYDRWNMEYSELRALSLGDLMPTARVWALDAIKEIKKTGVTLSAAAKELKVAQEEHRTWVRSRVDTYTLAKSTEVIVEGLRKQGRDKAYCDRIDKIFHRLVPKEVSEKLTLLLNEDDIRLIFASAELTSSIIAVLRPHLRRCLEVSWQYGSRPKIDPYRFTDIVAEAVPDISPPMVFESWTGGQFDELIDWLISNDELWPQSICLVIYLETDLPLSRLLKARWDQVFVDKDDVELGWDVDRVYLRLGERWRLRANLKGKLLGALRACKTRTNDTPLDGDYIFPTSDRHHTGEHITTVKRALRALCVKYNIEDMTPRELWLAWNNLEVSSTSSRLAVRAQRLLMAWRESQTNHDSKA